ncbi:MAG: Fe-S cluster assembly protein SufD [Bacteroidota bacterium]
MSNIKNIQTSFESFSGNVLSTDWKPLRGEAFNRFMENGFPTVKDEEWKYTNLAPISNGAFRPVNKSSIDAKSITPYLIAGEDVHLMVFVNGFLDHELSKTGSLPGGVIVGSLSEHHVHPAVKEHLGKIATMQNGTLVDLNTAFIFEGAFLHVSKGVKLDRPVHFLFINDSPDAPALVSPRNLFVAEESSNVQIIESFHTNGSASSAFTNAVTEVLTEQYAILDLTKVQLENRNSYHVGYTAAKQQRHSEFHITTMTLDGAIVRNNLNILLAEEQCTSYLYGLYLLDGNQLVDNHSLVDHAVPNCQSNELYKGIIDGKAQGVFNGKIFVRKDAQKTNAYQSNKNILLSEEASMNTKPQLEIFADDVKCSHGTTTGQLDEEALFYLRSRGIGEDHARAFLNIAFAADVIQKVAYEPLRNHLMEMMEKKLRREEF